MTHDVVIERHGLRVIVCATDAGAEAAEATGQVAFTQAELATLRAAAGPDGKIPDSMFKALYAIKAQLKGSRVTGAKGA